MLAAHPDVVMQILDDGFPRSDREPVADGVVEASVAATVIRKFAERFEAAPGPDDPAGIDVDAFLRFFRGMSRRRGNQLKLPACIGWSAHRQSAFGGDVEESFAVRGDAFPSQNTLRYYQRDGFESIADPPC